MPDLDDATMKIVTRITSFDVTSDEVAGNNYLNLEEVSFFSFMILFYNSGINSDHS
jgi:hypothetical protein